VTENKKDSSKKSKTSEVQKEKPKQEIIKKEEKKIEVLKVETKELRSDSSSSNESIVSMKDKLIRQISESISSYSLEKAHETAGVLTPKRSVPSSPLASSSSNSIHSTPIKA